LFPLTPPFFAPCLHLFFLTILVRPFVFWPSGILRFLFPLCPFIARFFGPYVSILFPACCFPKHSLFFNFPGRLCFFVRIVLVPLHGSPAFLIFSPPPFFYASAPRGFYAFRIRLSLPVFFFFFVTCFNRWSLSLFSTR